MKKLWILMAAGVLAVPLAASAQNTATTTGGSNVSSSSSAPATGNTATTNSNTTNNTTATSSTDTTNNTAVQGRTGSSVARPGTAVFTLSGVGRLVDQFGNTLTQAGSGQFVDQRGNVFTVDGSGRLVDPGGSIVSAPGLTVGTGQSSVTGTLPSLPGLQNQNVTLGPGVGAGVTVQSPNTSLQTTQQNLSLLPGISTTPGIANPAAGNASLGASGIVSGQVVSFTPGGSLTIRQSNGLQVTFPVAGVRLPSNLRTGRDVTVFTDQSTGIVQVTGVSAGNLTAQPTTARTLPGSRTGGGTISLASGRSVTVGSGTSATTTAGGSSSLRGEVVTVRSFDGNTLTVVQPNGSTQTLRINSSSSLPSSLGTGNRVVLTTRTVNGVTFVNTVSMATGS